MKHTRRLVCAVFVDCAASCAVHGITTASTHVRQQGQESAGLRHCRLISNSGAKPAALQPTTSVDAPCHRHSSSRPPLPAPLGTPAGSLQLRVGAPGPGIPGGPAPQATNPLLLTIPEGKAIPSGATHILAYTANLDGHHRPGGPEGTPGQNWART